MFTHAQAEYLGPFWTELGEKDTNYMNRAASMAFGRDSDTYKIMGIAWWDTGKDVEDRFVAAYRACSDKEALYNAAVILRLKG